MDWGAGVPVVVTVGAAAGLLVLLLSWGVVRAVRALRWCEPTLEAIEPAALPDAVGAQLAPGSAQLEALGFVPTAAARTLVLAVADVPTPSHALVFLHPDQPVNALLTANIAPQRDRDDAVTFASRRADGRVLFTRNRAAIAGPLPLAHIETHDCWLPTWHALYDAHVARMHATEDLGAPWVRVDGAETLAAAARNDAEGFVRLIELGRLVPAGVGRWRASWGYTLACVARAWRWLVPSLRRMDPYPAAGAASASQIDDFERDAAAADAARWPARAKWLLFALTAALAAASFGLAVDTGTLAALMLVLLVHEGGHLLAMRWTGYRDLKVFFLPFLGAAVSGRHDRPTLRQELLVLYAGPLPGLVLGLAAIFALPADMPLAGWWRECAVLAIILNALNLLPIHPLDGGKIFELLLLSRWPWLAFAARVAGIGVLAGWALAIDSGIARSALIALSVLMALGIGQLQREARVARRLQRDGVAAGLDRSTALAAVFERIDRLGYRPLAWPLRRAIATALLPGLVRAPVAPAARAAGALLYALLLAGAAAAVVLQVFAGAYPRGAPDAAPAQNALQRFAVESERADAALLASVLAEPDGGRRWALIAPELWHIVESTQAPVPMPSAHALLGQARELAPRLPDAAAKLARLELAMRAGARDVAGRQQHVDAALAALDAPGAPPVIDTETLFEATAVWLDESGVREPALRRARIERSLALAGDTHHGPQRQRVQAAHADLLLAAGEREAALALARDALDARDRVDVVWVADGPVAALAALDTALAAEPERSTRAAGPLQSMNRYELLRHGMLVAGAAGRTDWQRAHGAELTALQGRAQPSLPWWLRAYLWTTGGQPLAGATLRDVEAAHWRGDAHEAARIAAELRQRLPNFAVTPPIYHGPQLVVAPTVVRHLAAQRRALAERYGLPVRELAAASGG